MATSINYNDTNQEGFTEMDILSDERWYHFINAWLKLNELPLADNAVEAAEWHGFSSTCFEQKNRIEARKKLLEYISLCRETKTSINRKTAEEVTAFMTEAVQDCWRMTEFMGDGIDDGLIHGTEKEGKKSK
jgi:hypothetical protein